MRILHVFDHSLPLHSGYTFRSANILREQRNLGWETFHLTSPKQVGCVVEEEVVDGLHFYRTAKPNDVLRYVPAATEWGIMRAIERRLLDIATRLRPDLLHAHSPVLNALPALRVGRLQGIPVVYEIRGFWEDAAVDLGTHREWGMRYRLTRGIETYAVKQADQVVTICEGLRNELISRGIPAQKIGMVPNAVDVDRFSLRRAADPARVERLGLQGCNVIGFVGSFYAYEGLDLLLSALPEVLKRMPNARLLLVGGGPQEDSLKAQAVSLGIGDKVRFIGRVPHAEVNDYYDLVDVLAYPRHPMRLTELVTPLKPLEAMAQGQLLVASDVGGHRELVQDGVTGMLFRAGDREDLAGKLTTALELPDGGASLRKHGRRFVETERTWARSVSNYRDIYAAALGRN